jgi:hypothetical protein
VDLRSIVIYSELKNIHTIEMKSDKKERNSKKGDSTSNLKSSPIKCFARNCMRRSNW